MTRIFSLYSDYIFVGSQVHCSKRFFVKGGGMGKKKKKIWTLNGSSPDVSVVTAPGNITKLYVYTFLAFFVLPSAMIPSFVDLSLSSLLRKTFIIRQSHWLDKCDQAGFMSKDACPGACLETPDSAGRPGCNNKGRDFLFFTYSLFLRDLNIYPQVVCPWKKKLQKI